MYLNLQLAHNENLMWLDKTNDTVNNVFQDFCEKHFFH